jgi:nucleoside 2-deoxyribosyltransferase
MKNVYIASKMDRAGEWRKLYSYSDLINIVSRWPFLEPSVDPTPNNAKKFWRTDYLDIQSCDFLICFAAGEDKLRGALVEAGMAIGMGKTVIVIGNHDDYGTWKYHEQVISFSTMEAALEHIIDEALRGKNN